MLCSINLTNNVDRSNMGWIKYTKKTACELSANIFFFHRIHVYSEGLKAQKPNCHFSN